MTYFSFNSKKSSKGRFETSSQYAARRARLTSKPLFDSVYMWSPLGFSVAPSWCEYNADTRDFTAHFALYKGTAYEKLGGFDLGGSHEVLRTATQSYVDYSRSYRAQNAFGAEVTVDSEGRSTYGFGVMNWSDFRFVPTSGDGNTYRLSYKTSVSPTTARRLEKDIRVLYVGYSTTPYQLQDIEGKSATYDSPYSSYNSFYYTALRLKEVWFYDSESGTIFGKTRPTKFSGSTKTVASSTTSTDASGTAKFTPRRADGSEKTNANCCAGIRKTVSSNLLSSETEAVVSVRIRALSDANLRLATNEMFARHGLTFKDPKLQAYFCARKWYKPDVSQTGDGAFEAMSDLEKKNLKLLSAERAKRS